MPRLIPTSSGWTYVDPLLTCNLIFTEDMSILSEPIPADFVLTVDDVVKTVLSSSWLDLHTLTLTYNEAVLGPGVVRVRFSTKNPDFISVAGEIVTPFDMVITAP